MTETETSPWVGIDVATAHLDIAVRPTGEAWRAPDAEPALAGLVARLREVAPRLIAPEATGGLERPVTAALAAAGLPVAVVNPRQVRDFARATGTLAKTDALAARVLALFAERVRPEPRPLPDATTRALGARVARRRLANGTATTVARVAGLRKLLIILNAMVRDQAHRQPTPQAA